MHGTEKRRFRTVINKISRERALGNPVGDHDFGVKSEPLPHIPDSGDCMQALGIGGQRSSFAPGAESSTNMSRLLMMSLAEAFFPVRSL